MLHVHYSILQSRMQELEQFTGSLCHFLGGFANIKQQNYFYFPCSCGCCQTS